MITLDQYFAKVEDLRTPENAKIAKEFLDKVNSFLDYLEKYHGIKRKIDHETQSEISGDGIGGGGARRKDSKDGRPQSSHKEMRGVDVTDPDNSRDAVTTDAMLLKFGLYREHPDYTKNWMHLTDRAPKSGKRTFIP